MKKQVKKITALFLIVMLLLSMFSVNAANIEQEPVSNNSEVQNKINSIASVYPTGSYFTKSGNVCYSNAEEDCKLSNIPSRGGLPSGATVANITRDAWSCCAFARYVFYCTFGLAPENCGTVNSSNAQVGDYINFGTHYAIYLGQDSNYWYVYDSNYTSPPTNIVKYNRALRKSSFSSVTIYHASNYDSVNGSNNNYVDIGTDFYAYITNTAYWLYLSNDYDNVSAKSPTFLSEQIWKFEKLNDNSYIIQSSSNDTVLEVNGTNVQTNYYNGGDNQKWYILKYGDNKYTIKSKSRNYVLDLEGNANISGTNIQIYEPNGTDAQYFSIHKYDAPSVTNINLEVNGSTVRVNWDNITGSTRYDVYLIQSPWGWDSVKYSKKCTFNSNYCEFKNISPGEYAAFVVTKPNENSKQSSWKYFTICYNDYMPDNQIIFNNHIYSLYNDTLTWEEAKVHCEEIGGHLVTITNKEEQNVITDLLKNQYCRWYFLGASSTNNNGNYKWVTNEDFVYTNWNNNIPNSKDNYLMATTRLNGNWEVTNNNGYDCAIGYICEIESASIHPSNTQYYKSNKYELYDKTLTWEDANQLAKIKGGHLVTITSQEEEDFIEKLINNGNEYYYWLGGKKNSSNNFEWTNSENFNYSNWATNEPNNTNNVENYIFKYKSSGKWNDNINFINNIGFIIEYDNYIKLGDINSDGKISVNDVTELQMYISQSKDFSDEQKILADYNQDGIIEVLDVTDIQQLIANS